jgi:phosphohistidine phosphatase
LADHERPLDAQGEVDAANVGKMLRREGLTPQRVLSSTATRAMATAKTVAEACGLAGRVELRHALYGAEAHAVIAELAEIDGTIDCVLVVGHNPTLEALVGQLTGRLVSLPTAGMARVILPVESWDELHAPPRCELSGLWVP